MPNKDEKGQSEISRVGAARWLRGQGLLTQPFPWNPVSPPVRGNLPPSYAHSEDERKPCT